MSPYGVTRRCLCVEFNGHRWVPTKRGQNAMLRRCFCVIKPFSNQSSCRWNEKLKRNFTWSDIPIKNENASHIYPPCIYSCIHLLIIYLGLYIFLLFCDYLVIWFEYTVCWGFFYIYSCHHIDLCRKFTWKVIADFRQFKDISIWKTSGTVRWASFLLTPYG